MISISFTDSETIYSIIFAKIKKKDMILQLAFVLTAIIIGARPVSYTHLTLPTT